MFAKFIYYSPKIFKNSIELLGYQLFEKTLKNKQSIDKIRLFVQARNRRGARFWKRNGYEKIGSSWDKKHFLIDIYEKTLKY